MNGIRGKPSTSPPVQITGQQQILSSVPPPRGQTPPLSYLGSQADVYQQPLYQQSQAQSYQQYQLGFQPQGYDVGKPNYAAPRMPSSGVANQQTLNMYQSQQTQGMRPTAPFYSGQQQQQGIRQRYPSNVPNTQNQNMYPPTGGNQVLFINSQPPFGSQPTMMMQPMMRMPGQQFNPTSIPPQQSNIYQSIPQQPPTTYSQGYGNLPMFYNQNAAQQPPRPQSTGHTVSRQKHMLKITDPTTGKDVLLDNQQPASEHSGGSSDSGSRSTPVSSSSVSESSGMSQSPHNEIAALFAAKVAATLSPSGGGGSQTQHRPPSEPSPAQQQRMQQPPPQHYQSPHDTGMPQQRMMDGGMVIPPDQQQQPVHMGQPSVPIAIPPNMHHQHRTHQNTPPGSVDPMHMNAPAVMDTDAMGLVIESIEQPGQPPLNSEIVVDTQGLSQGDIGHMHPMTQQTRFPQNVQPPHMHQLPPQTHRLPQEPGVHVPPQQVSLNQPPPSQPGLISQQQGMVSQPPPAGVPQQVSNQQPMVQNQLPPKVMHGQPQQSQAPPQQAVQQPTHIATSQAPPPVIAGQLPPQVLTNQPPPKVLPSHVPTQMANYQPPPAGLGSEPTYSTIHQPLPPATAPQPSQLLAAKSQQQVTPAQASAENMHEKPSPRRQSEPVVPSQRQSEPVTVKPPEPSAESLSSKQSEPSKASKQTEPQAQKVPQEPVKQVLVKDKSPPPPLSTERVAEEGVSVAGDKVSQARTSSDTSDSVKSDSKESREATPEVNIVPPTPVEKEMKTESPTEVRKPAPSTEATETSKEMTATEAPKKSKKKSKDYDKKAQQLAASSDFDAYIDKTPEPEQPAPTTESPTVEEEKENVDPVNRLSPDRAAPPPSQEDTTEEQTPSDEMVQKVEIKIEDPEELREVSTDGEDEMAVKDTIEDEVPSLMLRYKYSEEQWSPINPEGKKHYDREFLLQFQMAPEAVVKPPGLPEIPDIILDKPHHGVSRGYSRESDGGGGRQQDGSFDFTPKYMWTNTPGGPKGSRSLPRQPSASKNKDRGPPQRQINISISKDVEPLHKAEDAWKPSHKDDKKKDSDLDPQTEDLYKKTRSILNKLTPQKFQTLVSQMQSLQINTENKLKGVIDLVFEKAISEPNFSVAYANMCRCLSMFKVPSETKPGDMVNFRAVLLTRCQREFEKDKSSEMLFLEKRQEIEKAENEEQKKELKAELDYEESKAKRRSLGNIRFIGELFKLKMLTENIMHDCVFKLLRTKDPENLECLCRLLTTIGKELETDKAKPRMDQYFAQMTKIVNEKKTSSRVRFMLQDVIDLRKGKWIPRRSDNNPKTIEQIHQEAAKEAQDRAVQAQLHAQQKASQKGGGGGGRRGPQGGGMGPPSADGWNMVGGQSRTPFKSIDRSIDPTKMKISKQQVDESSIQLGPGGGASRFAGWGRGSTGGGARASQEKERPQAPSNRFSALSKPEEESRRGYSSVSPARGEGRGRGGFGQPPRLAARASQEQEREKAIAAVKSMGISQSAEIAPRERSRGREPEKERPSPVATPPQPELPKEEIDKKTKAILDEYLHIQDIKEAILCVKELPPANHAHFCGNALNHVLERSEVARRQTGHFLHDLVKNQIVSVDSYIKGLIEILEFAEDMEIDIPKIWKYLGELVGQMIQDGSVPLSFLKQAAKPLVDSPSNKAGIFVAEVLHDACHREGHKKIAEFWQSSGLQWTDFLPKNQIEQFLIDQRLEFTKGGDSVPTTPTTGLPMVKIEEELHRLIVLEKRDNEQVFDWIESNVDDPTTKRSKFIRALMTCVCNSAFLGEGSNIRVDPKEVSKRHDLLQKYLDHQAESELQALYALQALVTKLEHPPGVLRQMFDTLYDEDIISEDAFLQWEKSDEEPGKGVAMKQVVQFFTWLREAEDDNDS